MTAPIENNDRPLRWSILSALAALTLPATSVAEVNEVQIARGFAIPHLPIMITWQAPVPPQRGGRGGPPPAGAAGGGGRDAAAPPAAGASPAGALEGGAARADPPPSREGGPRPEGGRGAAAAAESRLYFSDYRDVNGMQFPFRLRRASGADTTEETTFDRFKINAKIDPKKFEVRKPQ